MIDYNAVHAAVARGGRSQLRDQAAAYIRELIAAGQAAPGVHLPLDVLADSLSMSVTPVREALLLLAADGIVLQEPNRGFRVAAITRRDISDTYFVYSTVAGELAARAAAYVDDELIAELRTLDVQMRTLGPKEHERIEDGNYALHDVIYGAAHSPRLVWFIETSARFVPRRFWAVVPGWLEWNKMAHAPIIDALERRDAAGARAAMEAHALEAADLLISHFDALSLWND